MIEAVKRGSLSLEKLEALTSVCSVGIDMVAVPGDTPASTLSAPLSGRSGHRGDQWQDHRGADHSRLGKEGGRRGGVWGPSGRAPVMNVSRFSSEAFIARGGRIPAPVQSMRN
jgi:uncharacterized protein (UPF0210 family)